MTCLVLLEAFTESKQLLQTPQPLSPAFVQVSGWFRRLGSSDFRRAFRFAEWTLGGSTTLSIFGTSGCPLVYI